MDRGHAHTRWAMLPGAVLCLLGACASQPPVEEIFTQDERTDLSGHWELDYERSDNVQRRLRSLLLRLQKGGYAVADPGGQGVTLSRSRGSLEALVGLAQLADEVTRSPVLEIAQTEFDIAVERDQDFALTCVFHPDRPLSQQGVMSSELCGWVNERLVFQTGLPDGLTIFHQFTLAPDGDQLHIATTLRGPGAASPFTVSRFYNRYEPLRQENEECSDTLTRGRVCAGD
ncbi:MAG: hypothetical protein AAGA68_20445 [Pseudomonadota bacterium]